MRTRLSILPLMAVLAGVVSCQKAPVADPQPETPDLKTFYATIEEDATKVFADEKLRVLWDADDRVSIFDHYTLNEEYRFTGETGANAGWFEQIPYGAFVTGNDLDLVYAVYPYRKSTAIDNDGILSVEYPAEQVFRKDSFGLGANTMVSVTEDNRLQFRNGCGYLVLKLYGHLFGVSSITLRGNAGEPLAGKALVAMEPKGVPSVKMTEDAQSEVTLVCKDPVVLGDTPEEAVAFWFAIPPTTFDEGFTIEVKGCKGEVVKRTTTKPVKVPRNLRVSMAPMSVEETAPWVRGLREIRFQGRRRGPGPYGKLALPRQYARAHRLPRHRARPGHPRPPLDAHPPGAGLRRLLHQQQQVRGAGPSELLPDLPGEQLPGIRHERHPVPGNGR